MTKQQIKGLQQILADTGFYTGAIDGLWGPNSETAKIQWETANHLPFKLDDFMIADSIRGVDLVRYSDTLFTCTGASVDVDGGPHAYHPTDNKGLDYLASAGHPGNWWGVVTVGGKFLLQGPSDPAPGYCISTTSLKIKDAASLVLKQVNAEEVPFIVLPGNAPFAALGDYGTLWYPKMDTVVHVLFADVGPRTHYGEISYKAAQLLKLPNSSPKNGGVSSGIYYFIYPKTSHAEFNPTTEEWKIDLLSLVSENINTNAQPHWDKLDKKAILTYYDR